MCGFKIKINNENINIGVNNGILVLACDMDGGIHINGVDFFTGQRLKWKSIVIKKEDKVRITASDILDTISPSSSEDIDKVELINEYNSLKRLLKEKGLIK